MKNLKQLGIAFALTLALGFYGCTTDSITEKEEETNAQTKIQEPVGSKDHMLVLITFYEEVTEEEKEIYRRYYIDRDILKEWERCDEDSNSETWTVSCGVKGFMCRNGNPPTKPDKPVAGQTERMMPNASCADL